MGNGASSNGVFKVLLLDGRIEAYKKPIRAAELMVEHPGQFVCDSSYLKVGHRIQWLLADEQLERCKIYFLLPMDLLYSTLTHEEMTSLNYKVARATKHAKFNHLRNIFPVFGDFCMFPSSDSNNKRLEGEDDEVVKKEHDHPLERYYSKQRSWRPTLETIDETP